MLSKEMLFIFFRVLNFAIVMYLLNYIFRKYLINSIKLKMSEYIGYLLILKNKRKDLIAKSDQIEIEIKKQEKTSEELLEKIKSWKQSIELNRENELSNQKQINDRIADKLRVQEELLTFNKLQKNVLPDIIVQSQTQLINKFEDIAAASIFKNQIIEFMKRSL